MILVLFIFSLLYPLAGLRPAHGPESGLAPAAAAGPVLTYAHPFSAEMSNDLMFAKAESYLLGHSLLTTLAVASFQKDIEYQPDYPWGRILALVEVLFTSTLIALFLLAVRRQFRR